MVLILGYLSLGGVAGTCSGAVKCVDIARNTDSVGRLLVKFLHGNPEVRSGPKGLTLMHES